MLGQSRRKLSDFSEELRAHIALERDRLLAEGLNKREAEEAARRNLGNLLACEERFFESRRWLWLDHWMQDIRYALRRLRKTPVFTASAVLTLALGIGATTAIFTLVHAVLLKALPVADPHQLYRVGKKIHCCVWGGYTQDEQFSIFSYDLYKHLRDHTPGFEELAAFQADVTWLGVRRVGSRNAAQSYFGEFVSGNYFSMFGISAFAGRAITAADDKPGAAPAIMMSYGRWQKSYGLDPSVIGSAFEIDGQPFTIAGITPPGFYGDTLRSRPADFWIPLAAEPIIKGQSSLLNAHDEHWLEIIGRLSPTANVAAVQARMRVELQHWLRSHEGQMAPYELSEISKQSLYLTPGGAGITSLREQYGEWLQLLLTITGLALLIVCANVASLMLVRGLERRQQTSVSMALGAAPFRLVRQALTESVLLSVLGGLAGLAVAFYGTQLILHFAFEKAENLPISANPSLPVLGFAFAISLVTGIVFGIAPAWMASRIDPVEALRGANRSTRESASMSRKALVVLQAALSLALLSASGLLTKTLRNLEQLDFGFETKDRIIVDIDPVLAGYQPGQLEVLYRRIRESLEQIPGVAMASYSLYTPLSGDEWNEGVFVEGAPPPGPKTDNGSSWVRVSTGYFEAIGNRMIKGRPINERDTVGSRHVAVVNEAFARHFFKNQDPIGKRFGKGGVENSGDYEIVGVVKDARYWSYDLEKPTRAMFFLPSTQSTVYLKPADSITETKSHYFHDLTIRMRPGVALPEDRIRLTLASVDPKLPIIDIHSFSEQVESNFSQQRLIARMSSLFGILALVLASIGLYGVTAYGVERRTSEIGIRMALGANRREVSQLVLRGAFLLIVGGLVLGIPLALAAGSLLGNQLYGISRYDPLILSSAVLTLALCALVAAIIPALRAASISPMQALRVE